MRARSILGWVVTPFFILTFGVAFLTFHIIFVVTHALLPRCYRRAVELGNLSLVLTLRLAGTRIRVTEQVTIPRDRSIIFVSNHQSLFDIPLILWHLRRYTPHFVAKRELGRGLPALSHALRNMGAALIDRSNSQQALSTIQAFGAELEARRGAVIIFPEGTRARDGVLKKFKPAGLRALLRSMPSALVVPVAISGSWEITRWGMRPIPFGTRISITTLAPIEAAGQADESVLAQIESSIQSSLRSCV